MPSTFGVVGVGAAAGGLSGVLGLLERVPPDLGMAFVVALHLPGMDGAEAARIVARGTPMRVVQLGGPAPAPLEPGCLYLMPHRSILVTEADRLGSLPAPAEDSSETGFDRFFRSLADAYGSRCIAVLLSGACAEGTLGLARIREQGGVAIAQVPEDADHGSMPRAAITAGAADLILPAAGIGERLARLRPDVAAAQPGMDEAALERIMEALRLRTGREFGHYRRSTVLQRIQRRRQVNGLPDLAAYGDYLRDQADEAALLLKDMLLGVSGFFRDPAAMDALERQVLRGLVQTATRDTPIRIWVVGCGTGEEAYSVGIQLHELGAAAGMTPFFQVFATNSDDSALAVGRRGVYPAAIANDLSPTRLSEFFEREEHHYRVTTALRLSVLFTSHDVLHDAPFSRVDLILCRNLLSHLDSKARSTVIDRFQHALAPTGHLLLGRSETPGSASFVALDASHGIFGVSPPVAESSVSPPVQAAAKVAHGRPGESTSLEEDLQSMKEELTLLNDELKATAAQAGQVNDDLQNHFAAGPAIAVFVDKNMRIRRCSPGAAALFGLESTAPGRRLAELARKLDHASLEDDAAQALRTLQPVDRTVQGPAGRSHLLRIQPYRTGRNTVEGVLLSLSDATTLHQAQDELRDLSEFLRLALESTADQAAVRLGQQGRIAGWNSGAGNLFGYESREVVGQPLETLLVVEERGRGIPEEALRLARLRGQARLEQRFRRKDGSTFPGSSVIRVLHGEPPGFVQVIRDLSELRAMQSERDAALARVRDLENGLAALRRRQDESLDVLASQLRQPLNLVQINAEMLLRLPETRGIPSVVKVAGSIGKAVAGQSRMIDGLRDLALARAGRLTLDMQPVDLCALVEDVVRNKQQRAAARSLSLEIKRHPAKLLAICDAARIREILCTLIDNAIESTEHGSVTIAVSREGAFARLCVADAGPGLSPEARAAVFDPDDLAGTTRLWRGPDPGIGLPLVRELVAAHDGEIVAESEGPGHGTRFIVGLRLAEAPFSPIPAAAGGLHPFRDLRVVLVDDSAEHLAALEAVLTAEGARVESFDAPRQALERLRRGSVDLLISDLGMPEMDGYELIAHVRRQPQLAALRAIALTGYGRTRGPGHAVKSGFDAHTTKPIALEELKNIVASLRPAVGA